MSNKVPLEDLQRTESTSTSFITCGVNNMPTFNQTASRFPICEDVHKYKYESRVKIGQGTYGEVFKVKHRHNNQYVAIKRILLEKEKEGFPLTAIREIKILQLLKNINIVNLIEICKGETEPNHSRRIAGPTSFYLVLDFCDHDLAGLLANDNVQFNLAEIKSVISQLFNGLSYIHSKKILHRDMKSANVLITRLGVLKLADFGLGRMVGDAEDGFTNRVVTLWYRPPELLLGARKYGPSVDLWGAGCIMAEMWTRSALLPGNSESEQLDLISKLCGSITPEVWPSVKQLELFNKLQLMQGQKRRVKDRLSTYMMDSNAHDLLDRLLTLDPSQRINAADALHHDFLWSEPLPGDLSRVLSQFNQSMFEYYKNSRRRRNPRPKILKQNRTKVF
ncbi:cyclin-dependent kinase 9 [Tetranychus urticae]|uniref:Protein kinase domain-containing protein n=1 Tax=Tetranychus urticae TaxID=32264 RepID=T1KFQ0_TETUR|nr:cyclin-dependent kinase 9 [Tetranychus urticae]